MSRRSLASWGVGAVIVGAAAIGSSFYAACSGDAPGHSAAAPTSPPKKATEAPAEPEAASSDSEPPAVSIDNLAACCAALRLNANAAPPKQVGAYLQASDACDATRNDPELDDPNQAAAVSIRRALGDGALPAVCQ